MGNVSSSNWRLHVYNSKLLCVFLLAQLKVIHWSSFLTYQMVFYGSTFFYVNGVSWSTRYLSEQYLLLYVLFRFLNHHFYTNHRCRIWKLLFGTGNFVDVVWLIPFYLRLLLGLINARFPLKFLNFVYAGTRGLSIWLAWWRF